MAKSEMVEFKEEMKGEGLHAGQISLCRDIVREIYIGQNIRDDGIFKSDFKKFDPKLIGSLLKYNYIKENKYYSNQLYCTAGKGSKVGKSVVTNLIDKNTVEIERLLNAQPQKVLNFIIKEHYLKRQQRGDRFIYPVDVNAMSWGLNWEDHLRKNDRIHTVWTSVLSELKTWGLCIRTHSYVAKDRDPREEYYVISPEVFTFLVERCRQEALSLTDKDSEKAELYTVLSQYKDRGELLWDKLTELVLEEEKVNEVVDEMEKEGITSGYKGFKNSEAPFSIKDQYRYEEWLEKNLWEPVVESLLEHTKGEVAPDRGHKTAKNAGEEESEKEDKTSSKDGNGETMDPNPPIRLHHSDLKILLGQDENDKEIFWVPENEINWSFAIVGSSGTGKTQTVKAILSEFTKIELPYILFDFRNDYISKAKESEFGQILDLSKISINPLELDGNNTPKDQKYEISDIVDLVYGIGTRQVGYIRNAIKRSYEDRGINEEEEDSWSNVIPTFVDIQNNLNKLFDEGDGGTRSSIKGIFARLDPLFDYGIFSAKTMMPFEELMRSQTIVDLGTLPNDTLKAVVCEFFMRKLRYYLYKIGGSQKPRLYVIIDEAHRLKYEREASAGELLKEVRKYGVGMLLATQEPVDFTDVVYNNIGGIMSLQLTDPRYAKSIAEHLGGKVTWRNVKNDLSSKFSAYVKFSQNPDAIKFDVIPYYKR